MQNKDVSELNLEEKLVKKLKGKNIMTINDLWILKRKELKEKEFSDSEIKVIRIKLQLIGLDIDRKKYI